MSDDLFEQLRDQFNDLRAERDELLSSRDAAQAELADYRAQHAAEKSDPLFQIGDKVTVRDGACIGQDMQFHEWRDDGIDKPTVFDIVSHHSGDYWSLKADGYGGKPYGNGRISAHERDMHQANSIYFGPTHAPGCEHNYRIDPKCTCGAEEPDEEEHDDHKPWCQWPQMYRDREVDDTGHIPCTCERRQGDKDRRAGNGRRRGE